MSVFDGAGKVGKRRPSLRGKIMFDILNGQERIRAWPKKRGDNLPQKTLDQMNWFTQAQWATKYLAPELYIEALNATEGSPILPRDILTMAMAGRLMSFTPPGGPRYYSMQSMLDISKSLDVITSRPGQMLVRGQSFWTGADMPGAVGPTFAMHDTRSASNSASGAAAATKGNGYVAYDDIIITSLSFQMGAASAGSYRMRYIGLDDDYKATFIEESDFITLDAADTRTIMMPTHFVVAKGQMFALCISCISGSDTYTLPTVISGIMGTDAPLKILGNTSTPHANPVVGAQFAGPPTSANVPYRGWISLINNW